MFCWKTRPSERTFQQEKKVSVSANNLAQSCWLTGEAESQSCTGAQRGHVQVDERQRVKMEAILGSQT